MLRVRCPGCETMYPCLPDQIGRKLRCTRCQKSFIVRSAAPQTGAAGVSQGKRRARRASHGLGVQIGVAALTSLILGVSGYVAVSWYRTPSGPPPAPPDQVGNPAQGAGVMPAGYDQVTSQGSR